jgi:energy-coupling factor transporter ATP-binding protein EcfA2
MIIKELLFKNFKSFSNESKKQNFDKLDILSLIYGENNSGKSNVLKFINLLFKRKLDLQDTLLVSGQALSLPANSSPFWSGRISNDAHIFHKNNRTEDIEFEVLLAFNVSEISSLSNSKVILKDLGVVGKVYDLEIKGNIRSLVNAYDSEIILNSVFLNEKEIYSFKAGMPRYFQGTPAKSVLRTDSTSFENLMGLLNDCVLLLDYNRFLNQEDENSSATKLTPSSFKNWLHNLTLDPLKYSRYDEFLKFVKANSISGNCGKVLHEFDPRYGRKDKEIDVFLKTNSERLPINSFGTGIIQVLLLLSMIFETNSKIILIEELELNLSPKTQQEVLNILGNLIRNKVIDQVIFTSHSDMLCNTTGLSVYEVQLSSSGVSQVTFKKSPSVDFFKRDAEIDKQTASVVRDCGVAGPEWD